MSPTCGMTRSPSFFAIIAHVMASLTPPTRVGSIWQTCTAPAAMKFLNTMRFGIDSPTATGVGAIACAIAACAATSCGWVGSSMNSGVTTSASRPTTCLACSTVHSEPR